MKSFNDGPEQGCWALWLQTQLLGSAFLFVLHETQVPSTVQGRTIPPQTCSTHLLHHRGITGLEELLPLSLKCLQQRVNSDLLRWLATPWLSYVLLTAG